MGNKTRHTANLVSDNNIFVDIASDRVGIGSTQPTAKLNIVGIVSATSFRGDGSQLSGISVDSTSLVDSNSATRVQATTTGAVVTGILTATQFFGDASNVTGIVTTNIGKANVTIGDNPPGIGTASGDLWWESDTAKGHIYYDDGSSAQWVEFNPASGGSGGGGSYGDSDVDLHLNVSTASSGQILSWNGSDYAWVADQTGGGGGISLTDLSVTQNSAGTAALSYNNSNGVFSYTPPDLSSYLTSYTETDPVVGAVNGIVKADGAGNISAATAGTDYLTPTGDGSQLTGIGSTDLVTTWTLGANGIDHYTFTGPGVAPATDDPTIYLVRGQTYKFENRTGGHPFRIQYEYQNTGGTAYNDGIVNNAAGNNTDLYWEVRNDAPDVLFYQCTAHTNMSGKIIIMGETKTEGSWTATAGVLQNIDTITGISNNDFKTVEYTLHIDHASGMQAQKVLAMQTGSAAFSQEFAIMFDSSLLVSIGASVSGGNFYLNATPETGVSGITTYRFTRQTIR